VIAELLEAGEPVRALTRTPATPALPTSVEVVAGDFTEPASLDAALRGVRTVFLLWTAPPATVEAVVERLAADTWRGRSWGCCSTPGVRRSDGRRTSP
jgi:uncharacterized protein YbjT (DUF2867 family)